MPADYDKLVARGFDRAVAAIDPNVLTLFDADAAPLFNPHHRVAEPALTIEQSFTFFHAINPWVYDALVKLARDWVQRGRTKIGVAMLFEVLRWQWSRATSDPASEFKLNNNLRSRYARRIMEQEPDLADVFETRELKTP